VPLEHKYKEILWIDLFNPNYEDAKSVVKKFGVSQSVADELVTPSPKPKVEIYKDYLYCVFHFPAIRQSHREIKQEIDFIIGSNFIVTTHYDVIEKLHEFSKKVEVGKVSSAINLGDSAGEMFSFMLRALYRGLSDELDSIKVRLEKIEAGIFHGSELEMVEEISRAGRDLLMFRKILASHSSSLSVLESTGHKILGADFEESFRLVISDFKRINTELDSYLDLLNDFRETNIMLVSTKQNEAMKFIAIVAFIALPLSIITSILNISDVYERLASRPSALIAVIAAAIVLPFLIYEYAKSKKWL
jgi:magnesium transporter